MSHNRAGPLTKLFQTCNTQQPPLILALGSREWHDAYIAGGIYVAGREEDTLLIVKFI